MCENVSSRWPMVPGIAQLVWMLLFTFVGTNACDLICIRQFLVYICVTLSIFGAFACVVQPFLGFVESGFPFH